MSSNYNGEGKVILEIPYDAKGIFIKRLNRFLGEVEIQGEKCLVHIHDPGRLEELLFQGNDVLLKKYDKSGRKTKWELVGAKYKSKWIFTNSKFHRVISEILLRDEKISPFGKIDSIKPEIKIGESRLDYLIIKDGRAIWVEVKGCTLEKDGIAFFPDAPTERGRRHVEELHKIIRMGERGALLILIFHPQVKCFYPNTKTDANFSRAFFDALKDGLEVYPVLLEYTGKEIVFRGYSKLCQLLDE